MSNAILVLLAQNKSHFLYICFEITLDFDCVHTLFKLKGWYQWYLNTELHSSSKSNQSFQYSFFPRTQWNIQFQFRKSSMDVIKKTFGPIDFLPNYFFSAQLKLRAAAYNHLQYKQLLLVAKVSCQFIKPDASVILWNLNKRGHFKCVTSCLVESWRPRGWSGTLKRTRMWLSFTCTLDMKSKNWFISLFI